MKYRNGFVSNSSSSSFVMVGCPLTKEIMEKFSITPDFIESYGFLVYVEANEYDYILGKQICSVEDDYIEDGSTTFEEINATIEELSKASSIPVSEFKIVYGTASC